MSTVTRCSMGFWLVHCATQWLLSIDWLISGVDSLPRLAAVFLPNDCLFLTAFIMSSRNVYKPKKAARILRLFKEFKFLSGKNHQGTFETLLSLAGSWIRTVHTMFNTIFHFLSDFYFWKRFGMAIFVNWLINPVKNSLRYVSETKCVTSHT